MIIPRDKYLNRIIDYMGDGQIKVITGIRRCGKSVLLFDIFYGYLLKQEQHGTNFWSEKTNWRGEKR